MPELKLEGTEIPGMYVVDLVLHGDERGWFKENYQKAKMEALGLPAFEVVQNNFSFNAETGVTRGLHAEPWEKFISLANGKVFGAWVDLRKGPTFGKTFQCEITPEKAIFVPRGVANGYQTLAPNVTYTYLVNAHWSAKAQYSAVNLFDPQLAIDWPIAKDQAIISEKDLQNPLLQDVKPMEF
ncbi:MAG TPA: dTDP-4-dehydrorhamnose 3,5-epimerase family protein [Patescibacteria group bacterium]|nr:dTDP-4-dehydrorhamnose 3,5-epimerase family protein [Patescibacteria group bacterium]